MTAPGSHVWVNTVPTEPHLSLSDFQYRTAIRTRLGLKPLDIMPRACADCRSPMDINCDHFLICSYRRKAELNTRHDQVAKFIHSAVNLAGGCAVLEPIHLNRETRKRTDLDVQLGSVRTLIDVSIVHPTAPSHRQRAARAPLEAAKTMVNVKELMRNQSHSRSREKNSD